MSQEGNKNQDTRKPDPGNNADSQAVDKAPGEERGTGEKVTNVDLKGKKTDADLSKKEDRADSKH